MISIYIYIYVCACVCVCVCVNEGYIGFYNTVPFEDTILGFPLI